MSDTVEAIKTIKRPLILLIKPASGSCNMRCKYCFYFDEAENREFSSYGLMDTFVSHALIDKALGVSDDVTFSFQGGEPTVRGLDFFKDFASYAGLKASQAGKRIHFALQTNGYVIDKKWADFFKENSFLIGLSMDGNKKTHDLYRRNAHGEGTFVRVFRSSRYLDSSGVDFNILVTVTKDVAKKAEDIYAFFKKNGFRYQQYIPCLDPIADQRGSLDYSLTPELYADFLIRLFACYYKDWSRGDYVSIRYFDNLVMMLCSYPPESCGMLGFCPSNYVVEADGSVYPCDFYVLDGYRLGNLKTDSFEMIDEKRKKIGFTEKSKKIEPECSACRYFSICRGGCRRDRENFSTGELSLTYLCPAYKKFFDACLPELMKMAEQEIRVRSQA